MDLKIFASLSGSAVVAICGWFVASWLASRRERKNKRLDIRVSYLIEAYRNLANAAHRDQGDSVEKGVETAIHDIQLFGTEKQNELLNQFLDQYEVSGTATVNSLLKDMRDDLRQELHIGDISGSRFRFFRLKKEDNIDLHQNADKSSHPVKEDVRLVRDEPSKDESCFKK